MFKHGILFILVLILYQNQGYSQEPVLLKDSSAAVQQKTSFAYKVFSTEDHTYGYDVFANSRKIIHQKTIPAIQGIKGFKTKKDAEKVAKLVIQKLKNGNSLPSVSKDELSQLGIEM